MLDPVLDREIQGLWNSFWAGGLSNPLTAIEQITYLIFLKRLDDQHGNNPEFFPNENLRWSHLKQLTGKTQLDHMREVIFPHLKTINHGANKRMSDAVFLIPTATLLTNAINTIDKLFIPSRNQDILGDIYERLLKEIAQAGKNGQFRTPRHIIRAICDLVDPRLGEKICDPACGSAGFLINAYQHIKKTNTSPNYLHFEADGTPFGYDADHKEYLPLGDALFGESDYAGQPLFYGFDFDQTMVRLGWMNTILHDADNLGIFDVEYGDTLGSNFNSQQLAGNLGGTFDLVLANPPFTGNIDAGDIGSSLKNALKTNKTELLFVELILQLLRVGGRAAVIVPEGVLFGSTSAHKDLRQKLLKENQLDAVISLPGGVFQPYTGVKTSILLFTKGGSTKEVWFYEVNDDGQTLNAKRSPQPSKNDLWDMILKYRLRFPATRPVFVSDDEWKAWRKLPPAELTNHYAAPVLEQAELPTSNSQPQTTLFGATQIVQLFKNVIRQELAENAVRDWVASAETIIANDCNLTAGRYKPTSTSTVHYDPPAQIIEELQALEAQIQTGLANLLTLVRDSE